MATVSIKQSQLRGTASDTPLVAYDGFASPLYVYVGSYTNGVLKNAYIQLNLSAIPANAIIDSVTLKVGVGATAFSPYIANRLTSVLNAPTYTNAPTFDATSYDLGSVAGASAYFPTANNLIPMIQAWVNGTAPNYGFILRNLSNSGFTNVYNSNSSNWDMTITYHAAPNPPTITSPVDGSKLNSRRPTITWNFSDSDSGDTQSQFEVAVSRDNFATWYTSSGITSSGVGSWTVGVDLPDGVWQFAVRTADSSGTFGSWAFLNNITIDATAPTGSAADATTRYINASNKTSVKFTVNAADATSGLTSTSFATWGTANGQNDIVWYAGTNNGNGTWSYTVNFNNHDGGIDQIYYVHVYAYDAAGNNANIAVYTVYLDSVAPTVPTQTNGILYATSNGVSWSAFADGSASSGVLSTILYLQVYSGGSWTNVSGFPVSVSGISYSFTGLSPGIQYRWGVVYTDAAGNANALTYTTFTTNSYAVSTQVNLTAAGYTFNQKPKFMFTVTDANDSTLTNFQLQISTSSAFTTTVLDTTSGAAAAGWSATSLTTGSTGAYTPQVNLGTGTFYARIRAYDGKDWGTWSTVISFTVQAIAWATTVASDDTAISKRTIDELRTKVNAVRQMRGLAVVVWTDSVITAWTGAAPTDVRAAHLIELRQAITDIYTAVAKTAPTWADSIVSTSLDRKGSHWTELRNALIAA